MSGIDDILKKYYEQFGISPEEAEGDLFHGITEQIYAEYKQIAGNLKGRPDVDGKVNMSVVEEAKKLQRAKNYSAAKRFFEFSIIVCQRNNWADGIRYANEQIAACDQMIKPQQESAAKKKIVEETTTKKKALAEQEAAAKKKIDEETIAKKKEQAEKPVNAAIPEKTKEETKATKSSSPAPAQKESILVQKGNGRLQCPKCGNNIRNMIREQEDREHMIMDYPVLYAKKYHCGKCNAWWRREEE